MNPMHASSPNLEMALTAESADKRIEVLRRIAEVGSISEAARMAGVSYKSAWQAIETLSNLAGTPLVEKIVGGSGGGGTQLTHAGQQLLAGAELLAQARRAVFNQFKEGPLPLPALAGLGLRTSMRNQLPCTILQLIPLAHMVRVILDLGDRQTIAARITAESAQLLGLAPGNAVMALCKATGVNIAPIITPREGINVLRGSIVRVSKHPQGGELTLQLGSGHQLVGFAAACPELMETQTADASVDESAVVIALPNQD